ncbi:Urease operon accessory protein [Rhizobium leguminosarum]|uniref:Urease operon accessory protein n=1 Tax=Rhizobium leguminosarum TaxID=384 RepID=UPI0015FB065F|nr:Urease operon accessory protein [Rhizobium leguminosarum]MBA9035803.1 hypothetical protein [Rhizobium leguminosarum]
MPRKISIVGNGSFGCREAAIIDNCDFVVRFNDCRSVGKGGCRTDVVAVCNTGRPALSMVRERSWREKPAVASASEIWCVRDAMKFMELKTKLDPALDDFCDDYTAEFAMFAAENKKMFKVIPRSHHDRFDSELQSISSESYVVPSSGLMAISYALEEVSKPGDEIILAGFDHQGWGGHPFNVERMLIDNYIAEGRLRRLTASRT